MSTPSEILTPGHSNAIDHNVIALQSVIAQQYSSTTSFLVRFQSRMKKFGTSFKNVITIFILLFNP
jgi:hypothetical protein